MKFKYICPEPECRSKGPLENIKDHVHYYDRNHDNDPVKLELKHRTPDRKAGDMCTCGGNQDCRKCGGTGRIS